MKICPHIVIIVSLFCSVVSAQTLTEQLSTEEPQSLVNDAMDRGDVVRGAILFHQGNTNCAKCHRANSEQERFGPDLTRMDKKLSDEHIVESILNPSKTIKEGFETITVVSADGLTISGLLVSEDGKQIKIRDANQIDKVTTILRTDLDGIRPDTKSMMPDGLVNELKGRQQFLDLLRYVIDLKEQSPTETINTQNKTVHSLEPRFKGIVRFQQLNCANCHDNLLAAYSVKPKSAPKLSWSARHLNPAHLSKFIANPHQVKPGTTMPKLLGSLDEKAQSEVAESITHFLVAKNENQFQVQAVDMESARRGLKVFHSVGCVACHSPRNDTANEIPLTGSTPLGKLENKYSVAALTAFLKDPLTARPSGHMPAMQLTHREAVDVSNYLLQGAEMETKPWVVDLVKAAKGKLHFSEYNCASCHDDQGIEAPQPPIAKTPVEFTALNDGCMSGAKGNWPDFNLSDEDRTNISLALKLRHPAVKPSDEDKIQLQLTALNCIACHDRNGFGGVKFDRNPHFQTTNLNLGDQGRIPPTLSGVGAKLKPKWMRDVFVNGRSIRPYMKTRMPQYGEENIRQLIELFQKTDHLGETTYAKFNDQKEMRKTGLQLAGNKGLNCVACHTYKYKLSDTMPAVDLTEMAERLEKDWFYQYMLAPQHFSPNTVMPSFWPSGKAIRKDLAGTPEHQIEALWQYLIDGRQAGTPSGVVRLPLEIVVDKEAQMLRRAYPEIGKRGIGVGYPGGLNIAYDAEQMRLATIWKGKFVDPGGVWTGQGSGRVRPLGKTIQFTKGPELDSVDDRWIVDDGRPPKHQFNGYQLDKLRRPTFRYTFDTVSVEDYFTERRVSKSEYFLRRKITFVSSTDRDDLRFRVATSKGAWKPVDNKLTFDNGLKIKILRDHVGQLEVVDDIQYFTVRLSLVANERQSLEINYDWK